MTAFSPFSNVATQEQAISETPIPARTSDALLLKQFLRGRDETAFAELVGRHRQTVWNVCRRILQQDQDAEDAYQAVFLVLARKAASIAKVDAVGSWLYGVAYRTAMKARQHAAIRNVREKETAPSPAEQAAWSAAACRELQRILDEELVGLPVKYRAPFILCCLQGMSKPEAAQELGWKEGTVSSRLANARKLLQSRLARRGIALSAALTATALVQGHLLASTASLAVPFTVQAVLAPAALKTGAASVTPAAATLAKGVIQGMTIAKFKGAAALIALALVAGGAGMMIPMAAQKQKTTSEPVLLGYDEAVIFQPPSKSLWPVIESDVLGLAVTPDASKLITTGSHSTEPCQLFVWDMATGKKLATQKAIPGTRCIAMAPDGKTFACGEFGGMIRLRDVETGAQVGELKGHTVGVNGLAFSADGKWLVSGGLDKIAKVWDWKERRERWSLAGHTDMIYTIAISKSGKFAVSGGRDQKVRVWDLQTGKEKFVLHGHTREIETVAISSDESTIASGSWDGVIRLWDAASGKNTATLREPGVPTGYGSMIYVLAFSPKDDNILASATGTAVTHLWDLKTKEIFATIGLHNGAIGSLAWAPDGKSIITGGMDKVARWWDIEKGTLRQSFHNANRAFYPVLAMAHAPNDEVVAIATTDKTVRLHDSRTGDILFELVGHADIPNSLAYSPDGSLLASGDAGGVIKIWDSASGLEKRTLRVPINANPPPENSKKDSGVEVSEQKGMRATQNQKENKEDKKEKTDRKSKENKENKNGEEKQDKKENIKVSNFSLDEIAKALNLKNGDQAQQNIEMQSGVRVVPSEKTVRPIKDLLALVFSPDGKSLFVANGDTAITRFEVATWAEREPLKAKHGGTRAMALSKDGATLMLAGDEGRIQFFDLGTLKTRHVVEAHRGAVRALATSSTGVAASGGDDGIVKIWDLASGTLIQSFQDRRGECQALAFSPRGRLLANGGRGGDVIVRDLIAGQLCGMLMDHYDPSFRGGARPPGSGVTGLFFDADGQSLVSCGSDRKVLRSSGLPTILPLLNLEGHPGGSSFARFSPGGERLASGGADGTITQWTKELMPPRKEHARKGTFWDAAFSPVGDTVAVGSHTNLLLLDALRGYVKRTIEFNQPVCTVAYSPDGRYLAAGTGDWAKPEAPGQCVLFDAPTGKVLAKLEGHPMRMLRVQFSPDGLTLATSCRDKIIRLWDVPSGKLKGAFAPMQEAAKGVGFLPDGSLVAASYDSNIHFLDCATLKETKRIKAGMAMASLAISPDGRMLAVGESPAVGTGPGRIVLFDAQSGKELTRPKGHDCRVLGVAFTPDGRGLVAAGGNSSIRGEINYWDLESGDLRGSHRTPTNWMDAVAVSRDGLKVLSASVDGLQFWTLAWTHRERTWAAHAGGVSAGLFVDEGRTLATGGKDYNIALWDAANGNRSALLSAHRSAVCALAHDAKSKTLFSASEDGTIKLWDLATQKETGELKAQAKLKCMAVSPDGKTLASGGEASGSAGALLLWNLETRQSVSLELPVAGTVKAVCYSPDGAGLAVSLSQDQGGMIVVWEVETRQIAMTLPFKDPGAIAFSPDSRLLTVGQKKGAQAQGQGQGHGQGKIWVWDAATSKGRAEFSGPMQATADLSYSPGGAVMATAGDDDRIWLWPVGDRELGIRGRPEGMLSGKPATSVVELAVPAGSRGGIPVWTGEVPVDGSAQGTRLKNVLATGAVAAVGLLGFAGWVVYRRKAKKRKGEKTEHAGGPNPATSAANGAAPATQAPAASAQGEPAQETNGKASEPPRPLAIPCSGCGKTLKGTEALIGKRVKCPHCGITLVMQEPAK